MKKMKTHPAAARCPTSKPLPSPPQQPATTHKPSTTSPAPTTTIPPAKRERRAVRQLNHLSNPQRKSRRRIENEKSVPPSSRRLRRMEEQTKAFLMKTMDDTHIRLVKNITSAYDIFQAICKKCEGAGFHGDPYFIQHFLMETKYEEGSDVNEFFLVLVDAMGAASKATESVLTDGQKSLYLFHFMPASWKDDLRIWKGNRKYIPYDELKMSIEDKVRKMEAQTRYSLAKGTPESRHIKDERALVAPSHSTPRSVSNDEVCCYCQKPRHTILQCQGLQKDLRDGTVKAGTVLPANFEFREGNSQRSHPYEQRSNNSGRDADRGIKVTEAETTVVVVATTAVTMTRGANNLAVTKVATISPG
ncbi:hypothetical protein PC129_g2983 [Phytophthora cactorum]|uniref:Uncharacterized protein n=1 Tax=Phytophthora cactorum TaxID=29920 RepID=A0A8T1DCN1_9STRA|nr:hypothetical protein Pcac1_g20703 [Phytophthora cactorum]KAG2838054.1 hypothetical protein PC112_g4650 [Phytophthora cactorum]KAG2840295.1 hypothetical protein PC111_g3508 [Phytophthora cactorum]KAG2864556.1 hypothetical protein PC113_g4447 [Phytophthora cactorum]KAG2874215.1 hypothetical protein PC114_g25396 [Phytophthora cactorum]